MTEAVDRQLAELLREAGIAHHRAFAAVDGADPDWPTWYATFLEPRLRVVLGRAVPVAELARRLQEWEHEHARTKSGEPWPEFYARHLMTLRNPGN